MDRKMPFVKWIAPKNGEFEPFSETKLHLPRVGLTCDPLNGG
jgi:hypothetical protein